jgi:hypothetical protein
MVYANIIAGKPLKIFRDLRVAGAQKMAQQALFNLRRVGLQEDRPIIKLF